MSIYLILHDVCAVFGHIREVTQQNEGRFNKFGYSDRLWNKHYCTSTRVPLSSFSFFRKCKILKIIALVVVTEIMCTGLIGTKQLGW